jgi:diguanylate cyclase (GGDEF)-like protein
MAFRISKIGRRIIALVFVSVMVSMVAVSGIFAVTQVRSMLAMRKSAIEAAGLVYASAVADAVVARNSTETYAILRSIARVPGIAYAGAVDDGGRNVASLGNAVVLGKTPDAADNFLTIIQSGFYAVAVDIVKSGRAAGKLVIVADVSDLHREFMRAISITLLSALAAGLFGIALAIRLQARITQPILSLIGAMSHIRAARDYSTNVEHAADDETGVLVDTFNGMMAQINERDGALERLAFYDPLTDLPNRQNFHQHLVKMLENSDGSASEAALFLLDLDEFKLVNDTLGHSVGDTLLVAISDILLESYTRGMLLARLGGDEFAIVVENIAGEPQAIDAIGAIMGGLLKPIQIGPHELSVTASIGCALIPRDGNSVEELLRHADLALYSAKHEGRGRIHFYKDVMARDIEVRSALASELRKAEERGELEAHYQAQVDLLTGEVRGFESLLRWNHRERGPVPPSLFIPVAEGSGQIAELGMWILRESCVRARRWLDQGEPSRQVSVNVSIAQLRNSRFSEEVSDVLAETGFPAGLLCLEVTESLYAGGIANLAMETVKKLRALGVKLALDDFGTGYSSLSYLQHSEFDKLKIDASFVRGADLDGQRRMLLEGIVRLGQSLGFEIIAEGAETDGEVRLLRSIGVDCLQGFALSRPERHGEAIIAAWKIPQEFKQRFGPAAKRHRQPALG